MRLLNYGEYGVKTQFLAATAKRGARVAADYRGSKILAPFDPNVLEHENHQNAAELAFAQWCSDAQATGAPKFWVVTRLNFERTSCIFTPVFNVASEFEAVLAAQEIAR